MLLDLKEVKSVIGSTFCYLVAENLTRLEEYTLRSPLNMTQTSTLGLMRLKSMPNRKLSRCKHHLLLE